jgi:ribosomal protein S27AE
MKTHATIPIKLCFHCNHSYLARKNSKYCLPCSDLVLDNAKKAYQKRRNALKKKYDISHPGVRSAIARRGGIARAAKYREGMSSISYETPPVACPECGSTATNHAYDDRYDCVECLYSFNYKEGV